MSLTKLTQEEQLILSEKITKLVELNQKAIAQGVEAMQYDWKTLDLALSNSVLEYQNILNYSEALQP